MKELIESSNLDKDEKEIWIQSLEIMNDDQKERLKFILLNN